MSSSKLWSIWKKIIIWKILTYTFITINFFSFKNPIFKCRFLKLVLLDQERQLFRHREISKSSTFQRSQNQCWIWILFFSSSQIRPIITKTSSNKKKRKLVNICKLFNYLKNNEKHIFSNPLNFSGIYSTIYWKQFKMLSLSFTRLKHVWVSQKIF